MLKHENYCCDCDIPCAGDACGRKRVPVYYCDACESENYAYYEIGGEHYCEEHAIEYLRECFDDLSVYEMAQVLDIHLESLE